MPTINLDLTEVDILWTLVEAEYCAGFGARFAERLHTWLKSHNYLFDHNIDEKNDRQLFKKIFGQIAGASEKGFPISFDEEEIAFLHTLFDRLWRKD